MLRKLTYFCDMLKKQKNVNIKFVKMFVDIKLQTLQDKRTRYEVC